MYSKQFLRNTAPFIGRNPWVGYGMSPSPSPTYPKPRGRKSCEVVERPDHHCGDDLVIIARGHHCLYFLVLTTALSWCSVLITNFMRRVYWRGLRWVASHKTVTVVNIRTSILYDLPQNASIRQLTHGTWLRAYSGTGYICVSGTSPDPYHRCGSCSVTPYYTEKGMSVMLTICRVWE